MEGEHGIYEIVCGHLTSHRGIDLNGNTVGIAFVRAMCSERSSVGLTQDGGRPVSSTGITAAHELGHILNMNHDGSEW